MKVKITPFVYPNSITINQTAVVKIGKSEYEATVEIEYTVPEDASNMELFSRTSIALTYLEPTFIQQHDACKADDVISRIVKDAELWTPLTINVKPEWPDSRRLLAAAMGEEFSKVLKKWLGKDTLLAVAAENVKRGDDTCASHDHCDANMAMDEAFTTVMGRSFEFNFEESKDKEQDNSDDTELMNMAWDYAKAMKFFII